MPVFYRLQKFLNYQWRGQTKYYIHSPFVYQFFLNVLENQSHNLRPIENLRTQLRNKPKPVQLTDYGTKATRTVTLSHLEKNVAVRPKYGRLLYALANYFKPETILELGTSIGLSSAYLQIGSPQSRVITLEGSEALAELASTNHQALNLTDIRIITGEFGTTLPETLSSLKKLDLVFFDGNHQKEATLNYFKQCLPYAYNNSVFVFDDIYWSEGMTEAWDEIKKHPQVTLTIDVYQFGICFFKKDKLAKEDFVLRY